MGERTRINYEPLSGGTKFFIEELAQEFEEDTWWNGHNHVSVATGDQFDHESLYKTKKGAWILCRWSQWQGSNVSYTEVTEDVAKEWLVKNRCYDQLKKEELDNLEG